jgi:hypothetical protein
MTWSTAQVDRDIHVVPNADLAVHEFSARCWCSPRRDDEEPRVVVHNSADGREEHEEATKQ